MKNHASIFLVLSALTMTTNAQTSSSASQSSVVERGPYYRVWQSSVRSTNSLTGAIVTAVNQYTELGDGICYPTATGQYADSQDVIELTPAGAQAVHGQHKVQFATGNLNVPGAITLTTASGQVFASHPVAVYYFDRASGNTKLVAPLLNCSGSLHVPNQMVAL